MDYLDWIVGKLFRFSDNSVKSFLTKWGKNIYNLLTAQHIFKRLEELYLNAVLCPNSRCAAVLLVVNFCYVDFSLRRGQM